MTREQATKALKSSKVHGASVDFGQGFYVSRNGRARFSALVPDGEPGGRMSHRNFDLEGAIVMLVSLGLVQS